MVQKIHQKPRSATMPFTDNCFSNETSETENCYILKKNTNYKNVDGGYGWIVVLASFFCNVIVDGVIFSFGVFLLEISQDLKISKAQTAWIGSSQTGSYLIVGPFVSFLSNKYGCRIVTIAGSLISAFAFFISSYSESVFSLSLSFGIIGGIGYGFIYLPAIVIVGLYFEEKRAFATGIAVCGSGIGGFLLPPIIQVLINKYKWRTTMIYLCFLNLACFIFAIFFKPIPENKLKDTNQQDNLIENKNRPRTVSNVSHLYFKRSRRFSASTISFQNYSNQKIFVPKKEVNNYEFKVDEEKNELKNSGSLLKSPTFLTFSCAGFLTLSGFFVPFMYIVDRAVLLGISLEQATILLSVIGITNTVGRVVCGWLTDLPGMNALFINNVALIIGGLFTIISPIFNTYTLLIVYSIIFGFCIACFAALRSIITAELFGVERLTSAFGLLLFPQGIATIIGSPVAGWFYDLTNSYNASFYIAGFAIFISGVLCCFLPCISKIEKNKLNRLT